MSRRRPRRGGAAVVVVASRQPSRGGTGVLVAAPPPGRRCGLDDDGAVAPRAVRWPGAGLIPAYRAGGGPVVRGPS